MSAVQHYARASSDFAAKLAQTEAVLAQAQAQLQPLVQASSLGAEDMVLTHLLASQQIAADIFVLDTGKLHPATLALLPQIQARYGRAVSVYKPDTAAAQAFEDQHGPEAMYQSLALRQQCCRIRKTEPLALALAGRRGWLTGLRREQSRARAEVGFFEPDGKRTKVNPLAHWSAGDVWHYIGSQGIPYNSLHDDFYPSIGCAPCTRAVTLGEDIRSGRWWWEDGQSAKECGLHASATSSVIPLKPIAP